jgi:GNAT superfamily N-acetyltransferase
MNLDMVPDIIEDNLFGLYKTFATTGHYRMVQYPSYTWINADNSVFPQHVFQIDPGMNESSLSELKTFIRDDAAPPFLIFRDDPVHNSLKDILKTGGFRQVMQWPGMAIELNKNHNPVSAFSSNITVKKIEETDEINDWASMVELSLFNHGRLDRNTLKDMALDKSLVLYTGFFNGMAAGTLLSFTCKQISGLYMITTLPGYRKKGIAWRLINMALKDAVTKGCRYAVLESTMQGLSLYHQAGFKEYCNFAIYWMLGKNSHHG